MMCAPQGVAVFLAQINLAHLNVQISHYLVKRVLQNLVKIHGRIERGSQLVQQRKVFGAPFQCLFMLLQILVQPGIADGDRCIGCQHLR